MRAPKIASHFAEDPSPIDCFDVKTSDEPDRRAVEAMFEQFLTPNWEEYLAMPVSVDRVKSPTRHCPIDPLYPEPISEELLKITIELALATLEAAETALFARFNAVCCDPSIPD
jgi:hypothetical protein